MKKNVVLLVVLFLHVLFYSCSDSGTSEDVPCVPITCLNNGISNDNCGCDCPQGYVGSNCSTVVTPSKVIVTKVVVKSFDNLNSNGIGHDLFNGADIYIKINVGNQVLYDHSTFFPNAVGGLNTNYIFTVNPNLQTTSVNTPLIVSLWDYDLGDTPSDADDYMASGAFFPFNGNNFPPSIIVTDPSSGTKFEVFLSYQW
jgi:hypothetical protein